MVIWADHNFSAKLSIKLLSVDSNSTGLKTRWTKCELPAPFNDGKVTFWVNDICVVSCLSWSSSCMLQLLFFLLSMLTSMKLEKKIQRCTLLFETFHFYATVNSI